MLTRKELEEKRTSYKNRGVGFAVDLVDDALAKHDALLEIYHLLGGEGEPEDVVDACKERAIKVSQWASVGLGKGGAQRTNP